MGPIFKEGEKMISQALLEKYLVTELGVTGGMLLMMMDKIKKYNDIYDEFCYWLEKRNYDRENPIVVNGYTAKQIHQLNPKFEGIGVYNFLITLRENPERAEEYIKNGFKEM